MSKKKEEIKALVEARNFREIENKYGRKAYNKAKNSFDTKGQLKEYFTIKGRRRRNELKEKGDYDSIFEEFGPTVYRKSLPKKDRKEEIKRLKEEGNLDVLLDKYGDKYENYVDMKRTEIDTGSKVLSVLNRAKNIFKRKIAPIALSASLLLPAQTVTLGYVMDEASQNSQITYMQEIEDYNSRMMPYAQKIKSMNLSDIQIIMKVVDDMWSDIEGYGEPQKTEMGIERVEFAKKDGVGVCRNMADHVTTVLNEINPKYNARNVAVKLEGNGPITLANIDRNIIETNDTVLGENEEKGVSDKFLNYTIKTLRNVAEDAIGNHLVTAIDLPHENLTLIIDSTNPSIGVFKNGNIHMFWSNDGKGIEFRPMGHSIRNGTNGMIDSWFEYVNTFKSTDESVEELEEKWGIDAQNKALEETRQMVMPGIDNLVESQEKITFDERYKVNIENVNNSIKRIEDRGVKEEKTVENER